MRSTFHRRRFLPAPGRPGRRFRSFFVTECLVTSYRVTLDSQRVKREMGLIVEEVIERLTSIVGCEVDISVEINAKLPQGFDEGTIRTVSENSRTLRFEHFEFGKD